MARKLVVEVIAETGAYLKGLSTASKATATFTKEATVSANTVAQARVRGAVKSTEALRAEVTAYRQIASAAKKGSSEQIAAANLAANAERRLASSMGITAAETAKLRSHTSFLGRDLEGAGRGAIAAGLGFHGLGRAVGYASSSFLGGLGFAYAVKTGFDEMFAAQAAAAQTRAALKSTGDVAGVTAEQITKLAESLQTLSGYDDQAIQGAENLMLTFTNVRNVAGKGNDIFNQATLATLNLSRTFNQDLSQSAVQLGKALQDPIRGVTALRRIGVSFTEAQQKLINRLVNTGHVLDAQKVILREVNRETGNAAAAYGKTLPGQLDILKGHLTNLGGSLAQVLNPEVKKLTERFNKWLENPENKKKVIDDFTTGVHDLGAAFEFAAAAVGKYQAAAKKLDQLSGSVHLGDLFTKPFAGFERLYEMGKRLGLWGGGGGSSTPPGLRGPAGTPSQGPPGLQGPVGGGAVPPGSADIPVRPGVSASQRNTWFDAMIDRQLGRVQDIASVSGQIARLQKISGEITKRISVTKDVTRKLTLEDTQLNVFRQIKQARQQAQQDAVDALTLNVTRADLTKGVSDNIAALQAVNAKLAEQQKLYGYTRDRESQIIANEQQIQQLQQQATDAAKARLQAARDHALAVAQLAVTMADATPGYEDDLATRRHQVEILKKQLAADKENVDLQNKLFDAEQAVKAKLKERADAAKQAKLDAGQLAIARAGLTTSLQDNLAADLKDLQILRATHASALDIVNQQVAIKGDRDQIKQQEQQAAKDAADAALARRNALQFRLLGLGPTGGALIPGLENLRKRSQTIRDAVKGTFLDTPKTGSELDHIGKILAGKFGKVSEGVRAAIDQFYKDIRDKLKSHTGDQTKFRHMSSTAFVDSLGLNLTGAQRRAIETRFTTVGRGHTVPGGRSGQFTGGVTITGDVHVHGVQDIAGFENQIVKRAKARPHTRRGA